MTRSKKPLHPDAPLYHLDHSRPVTRRDFLRQGFYSGTGMVMTGSVMSLFASPRSAQAAISGDLQDLANSITLKGSITCSLGGLGGDQKVPIICFDLAGGANIAGSNVLVGGPEGQMDLLSTAGYSKLGLPGDMIPGVAEAAATATSNGDHTDTSMGLAFHSDSAFLRGIQDKAATRAPNINGAVFPSRSDNDTGDNPLNPMYGIAMAGANGSVVDLIGSRNSESGGNSLSPEMLINPEIRPTKVDRPTDVTGMVDTGNLTGILSDPEDVVAVMESIARISNQKIARLDTKLTVSRDEVIKDLVKCGYIKAADLAERFADVNINPAEDTNIVGATGIFSQAEFDADNEFRKTASVMKMVIDGYAGAGTITMGGYDYHTGDRSTGEIRDLRAGRCMGACLEYAARMQMPLMLYVFSDGSVASNGRVDNSVDGRGKGEWTGDNSSTAGAFFLVYNPTGRATAIQQQIGYMRMDASVETASSAAANNPNLLTQAAILNYMALNGDQAGYQNIFGNQAINASLIDSMIAFAPL